ncbi:hypothetical protein CRE_17403 [Caenorhabditis remanei]|uniref:DUF38 domain-containing protein n=1 Tax=Caenorhabditis remanei TaxID=31234 RepID=E3N267_CAERE|nr:hypothetical protein CRE_17403 [Caenorhabditis remanei]
MENSVFLRSKPLSYDASKSVLKSLSLEAREQIQTRIPSLRTINSLLPFHFDTVSIESDDLKINDRKWKFRPVWSQEQPDWLNLQTIPNICDVRMYSGGPYRFNKSPEEMYQQIFDSYLRKNTVIRGLLRVYEIPSFLKNRKDWTMKVVNLELRCRSMEDYECLVEMVDWKTVESVTIVVTTDEILEIFEKMEVMDKPPKIGSCDAQLVFSLDFEQFHKESFFILANRAGAYLASNSIL